MVKETGRTPSAIGRPSRPADAVQAADRDERGAGICRCQLAHHSNAAGMEGAMALGRIQQRGVCPARV